jgi:subtilisin family serine protease
VAILDTGLQASHPALAGAVRPTGQWDVVSNDPTPSEDFNGLDDDRDGLVDEAAGHGTFVGGVVRMVAPRARLLPIRVLNSDGEGTAFDVAEGIVRAVAAGADVINLSLASIDSSLVVQEAVRFAAAADVLVISAAGNWDSTRAGFPALAVCTLGVSAIDGGLEKAPFANSGQGVDLAAPGVNVYSTFPNPDNPTLSTFVHWSGTSIASAFMSGHAALLRSLRSNLSAPATAGLMTVGARPLATGLGVGLPHILDSVKAAAGGVSPSTTLLETECVGSRLGRLFP